MKKIGLKISSDVFRDLDVQFAEYVTTEARGRQKNIKMKYIRFYSLTANEMGYGVTR